jgi:transcriptional regulator of acetoin/glycerol metabolism
MPGAPGGPAPTNTARASQVSSAWNLLDTPLSGTSWQRQHAVVIEQSHRRSTTYGLQVTDNPDFSALSKAALSLAIEQNRTLYAYALPVMETLYEQISHHHNIVLLTDAQGVILHAQGDKDFLEKADRVALSLGVTWSERLRGTNGIGTALVEGTPIQVSAKEHYLGVNHILDCSAVPLFDASGKVTGVLNVSGDPGNFPAHTMALVRMSAVQIENQLFAAANPDCITLHLHSRPELIGTLMEGMLSFGLDGRYRAVNRSALFQLGLTPSALAGHTLESLLGLSVPALFDHYRSATPDLLRVHPANGVSLYAKVSIRQRTDCGSLLRPPSADKVEPEVESRAGAASPVRARATSGLGQLDTGDPEIARVISKLRKFNGRDIPTLIIGETGTGKELLAQAIHEDSPRCAGPFVAVNCASIPETLIESELFGYEEGAFTGARRRGSLGKILQANGGTLFLDEIGDMPLTLQARLLRVLQERIVTPLGSAKAIPVNVALVCATHRNLRDMIARGTFRDDLYYRLNGLLVKLPPLRQRRDFEAVLNRLLVGEHGGQRFRVAPEVLRLLKTYDWPGNIRQLANLVRSAMVMAEGDEIQLDDLPDDFLEEVLHREQPAQEQPAHDMMPVSADQATLDLLESSLIRQVLQSNGGNVSAAARALGVSRNRIYRKLQSLSAAPTSDLQSPQRNSRPL